MSKSETKTSKKIKNNGYADYKIFSGDQLKTDVTLSIQEEFNKSAIENENVDLSENGTIFIPAGYNVADLIAETLGNIKVIRGGELVESGSAENALVASGGLLPVYAYAYVKLKLTNQTHSLSDNKLLVSADIESNQNEAINVTYVVAVYKNGKTIYN